MDVTVFLRACSVQSAAPPPPAQEVAQHAVGAAAPRQGGAETSFVWLEKEKDDA